MKGCPHDAVPTAIRLLSRIATVSFARVHVLGNYARPRGVTVEANTRDGLIQRVLAVLGLNKNQAAEKVILNRQS